MRKLFTRIALILGIPGLALATALAIPAGASARAASVSGVYSITPSSGTAQAMHFNMIIDTGNWNYRAVVQCSSGGNLVFGGWHTFGSGTSNTATCSSNGFGHAVGGFFDYRQSAPIRIGCWTTGGPRSGTCHN